MPSDKRLLLSDLTTIRPTILEQNTMKNTTIIDSHMYSVSNGVVKLYIVGMLSIVIISSLLLHWGNRLELVAYVIYII